MMNALDQSLLTNKEEELRKIYEVEARKLKENSFKIDLLKRLEIEDFPSDLSKASKKNIQKALTTIKIKDHINLENGQKLLGLDEYDMSKITLSYQEKKLIRERVEHLLSLEKIKQAQAPPDKSEELRQAEAKLVEIQKENIELTQKLEEQKQEELELLKEVADVLVGPTQQNLVQGILEEAKVVNLKARSLNQVVLDSEMSRTSYSKKGIEEMSREFDQLLKEKHSEKQ